VVREWCEKFRLPPVERVVLSEAPLLFGGERGENMQMRTFNSDGSSRRTGMTLNCYVRFAAPVRGPLCIGQSTNFSMGLMLPVDWHW
jgi:CRISPR-associated protein Csb2